MNPFFDRNLETTLQDLDWEEEGEKDDRNEANKHFEYYMMALVEGPKVCCVQCPSMQACHS